MRNKHIEGTFEDLENELLKSGDLTKEEIVESETRADIIWELIKARNDKKISQRKLEELSGIRKTTIARMETGKNSPTIDTLLSCLIPLGKTLYIGDIKQVKSA